MPKKLYSRDKNSERSALSLLVGKRPRSHQLGQRPSLHLWQHDMALLHSLLHFYPGNAVFSAAHHPCLLDPQRPCWSANHFWNPGSCEVGKLGRLSQLWGSQDGNPGNLKGGLKKTSEPRGCFLFYDYNMFFFTTKDLFLKHIFEHFILQLLEAFKHSNSPSLPRNFPSRLQCSGFFAHFPVQLKHKPWWNHVIGPTLQCSQGRLSRTKNETKMKQTGKKNCEPRKTGGIIVHCGQLFHNNCPLWTTIPRVSRGSQVFLPVCFTLGVGHAGQTDAAKSLSSSSVKCCEVPGSGVLQGFGSDAPILSDHFAMVTQDWCIWFKPLQELPGGEHSKSHS